MLWGATRDKGFTSARSTHKGEIYRLLHPSLWMIVKMSDIEDTPILSTQDLPVKVNLAHIHGLIGVFADDLLKTGTQGLMNSVITRIRKLWKAGDPEFLNPQIRSHCYFWECVLSNTNIAYTSINNPIPRSYLRSVGTPRA
eukprot:739196-Amphidinium_carterae.1